MALDEALLSCFDPKISTPVLRLYGWSPPALSLGRFQDADAVLDLCRCRADNIPVVRRITGGGVIYHADELTYSIVCAPWHLHHAATIKESFRILTGFLLRFYRELSLDAEYAINAVADTATLGERTPFCFAGREAFDILINGRKIGGNAQRRLKNVVFQHGSIPLCDRAETGIGYLRERPPDMVGKASALADFGVEVCGDLLKRRLIAAFEEAMGSRLHPDDIAVVEKNLSDKLVEEKYGTDSGYTSGTGTA